MIIIEGLKDQSAIPGATMRTVHTGNMTLVYWTFEQGVIIPDHSHHHEQVTNILEGEMEFVLEGDKQVLTAGTALIIPPNKKHQGRTITK